MRHHRTESAATILICMCVMTGLTERTVGGDAPPERNASPARVFEGDFVLHREIPVGLVAGTRDHPRLVEVEWVRVEAVYGNAWGLTARVGWSPAAEATWSVRVELLDDKGGLLKHSLDRPTAFTGKADESHQDAMRYAEVGLAPMHWEMRRHAAKIRVILKPAEDPIAGPVSDDSARFRLVVCAVDAKSDKPIRDAAVVTRAIHRGREYRWHTYLHRTNARGECRVAFTKADLIIASVTVQKHRYATLRKQWSAPHFSRLAALPVVDLPERHVLEMAPAQTIGGLVQDQSGPPIAGAQVRVVARLEEAGGTVDISRSVQTDEEGRWRVEGIPDEADTISLGFKHPAYIGDGWTRGRVTGEELPALRDLKHVATMARGLTVSGRVLDDQGRPISRASIILAPASSSRFRYDYADTVTDTSGQFRFDCARNDVTDTADGGGSTGVLVEVPGYIPALQRVTVEPNLAPLEFRLKQGREVTVRVVDENNRPLPGAWTAVDLLLEDPRYGVRLDDTDEQGRFRIPNAPDHDMQLTVGKSGYITVRGHVLSASESQPVVTMRSSPGVQGRVVEARTGKPVSSFEVVTIFPDARRPPGGSSCPFKDGRFELAFDETPPESLQLKILAEGYKPTTSESIPLEGTRVVEFRLDADPSFDARALRRERGGRQSSEPYVITGTVVDPNGWPVPNATVAVVGLFLPETITDGEGKFKLRSPSRVRPSMERETPYIIARDRQRNLAAAVELDQAFTEDLTIKLAPGVTLSGKVTDAQGKGIPGSRILLAFRTTQAEYGIGEETDKLDPNGRYKIRAVPAGHRCSVNATAEGYGGNYVDAHTAEAMDMRMELEPMILKLANLDISGTVVDTEGEPVPRANVYVYGRGQSDQRVQTDARGRFVVHGVCAGTAQIQANRGGQTRLYGRVETEGGATEIKIVVGPRGSDGRFIPAKPPSLTGKPLPPLKDLGAELPASSYKDKIVLLCFFDMNQRPSRHCLRTLAEQAQDLKQEGVTVIAIQAAKVDESALQQWVQEQNFSLPVAAIKADITKAKFAWGIQSLPWLILTDAAHVVHAEGFTVAELPRKLESIAEEQ